MNPDQAAAKSTVTFEQLLDTAIAHYRATCAVDGVDPDLEAGSARLAHGTPAPRWFAYRLLGGHFENASPTEVHRVIYSAGHTGPQRAACVDAAALVAAAPNTPADSCEWAWAGRNDLPDAVTAQFARHPDPDLRTWIASSITLPDVLDRLADDPEREVVAAVVANPTTAPSTLVRLFDRDRKLHMALATHHPLAEGLIDRLASHPEWRIRRKLAGAAGGHPVSIVLAADEDEAVRETLATRDAILPEVLDLLARDPKPGVRLAVARRRELGISRILPALADDRNARVRAAAARNPNAPVAVLEQLAADPKPTVATAAGKRLRYLHGARR